MRSLNSWLGFSLSPRHTLDDPDCSQPQSSITSASLVQTKVSESSIGYDGSSAEGYGISPDTLTCSEVPDMPMNSDGSLSIMDAFRHTHCGGVSWPSNSTMPVSNNGNIQPTSMLTCEHILPTCFSTFEGSNHQINSEMQFSIMEAKSEPDAPKLEDFLGGVSLGGRFSERSTDQTDFENLYYASNHADLCRQKPQLCGAFLLSSEADMQAPLQLPEVHESTHPFQAHSLFARHEDDPERSICSDLSNDRPKYAHNLLHERVFEASPHNNFFSDCIMQPVLGSSTVGSTSCTTTGISALKTWLRQNQNNTDLEKTELSSNSSSANDPSKMANNMRTLALTMSPASQSSSIAAPQIAICVNSPAADSKRKSIPRVDVNEPNQRKSLDTFGQRTSIYRGVTRHRWTGRYEAHLWDNSSRKEGQTRKGRQVYLGGYDKEEKAARSYDLAALKYWGPTTTINFPLSIYEKELEEMKNMTRLEYVASLRRKSSGFSRGASMYRGVTRHHQQGRWQARIGRVAGNKDLYLGTFSTQEEAAEAYDIAAIKFRGINAVTNFEISRYDLKRICSSSSLVAGDSARRSKETETSQGSKNNQQITEDNGIINLHGLIQSNPSCKNTQNWQMLQCRDNIQQRADEWNEQGLNGNYGNLQIAATLPDPDTTRSYENFLRTASMPSAIFRNLTGDAALPRDTNSSNRLFTDHPFTDPLLMNSTYSGRSCERSRRSISQIDEGNSKQTPVDNYSLHAADHLSQPYLYLSQQQGSCIKPNYESNMLSSFMPPATMQINPDRPILASGNMPMFAAWNEN